MASSFPVTAMKGFIALCLFSAICACSPSGWLKPEDSSVSEKEKTEKKLALKPRSNNSLFSDGQWVDEDESVWTISVQGKELSAAAICGPSAGLKLNGTIRKNFLRFSIDTDDTKGIGKGRAMIVDEDHAYYIVTGDFRSHGLFHFDHGSHESDCQPESATGMPRDLRPPAARNLRKEH